MTVAGHRVAMLLHNDFTADARVHREAGALVSAGYDVTVVCLRSPGLAVRETKDGIRILRVADHTTASYGRPDLMFRQRVARSSAMRDAAMGVLPHVVHCHDSDTLATGYAAARRVGARLIYDAHELLPDSFTQHPMRGSWPIRASWRLLEHLLVPRTDGVITVSNGLADVLHRRYGVVATVVGNVPDLEPVVDRGQLREELGIPDDQIVLLYQGVLIVGRVVLPLVDVVHRLPEVALVIQGYGPLEEKIRLRAETLGVSHRVHLMGRVEPGDLHRYTCGADIGTVLLDGITLNHKYCRPNKLFGYFMAGLPVLATDLPEMAGIIRDAGAGRLVADNGVEAIVHAIEGLVNAPEQRRNMSRCARSVAETRYNWPIESEQLLRVYEGVLGTGRSASVPPRVPKLSFRMKLLDVERATASEIAELVAFHNRAYGTSRQPAHWRWQYQSFAPGKAVFALARKDGRLIGTQAAMPIPLLVADQVLQTGKSENTLLLREFRGQGVMEDLYEFMVESCRERDIRLLWGFTNAAKAFGRYGFEAFPVVESWNRPGLNLSATWRSLWRFGRPMHRRALSMAKAGAKLVLAAPYVFAGGVPSGADRVASSALDGVLFDELERSWDQASSFHEAAPETIALSLGDGFLDWRARHHPFLTYSAHVLDGGHGVAGYALVSTLDATTSVAGWEGRDHAAMAALLYRVVQEHESRSARFILLTNGARPDGAIRQDVLRSQGFRRSQVTNLVVRDLSGALSGRLANPACWRVNGLWTEGYHS